MSLNETAGSGGSTALLAVYIISSWLGLNLCFAPRQMKFIDRKLYSSGEDKGIVQTSGIVDQNQKGADLPAADSLTAALNAAVQAHEQSAVVLRHLLASYSGDAEDSKGKATMRWSNSTRRLRWRWSKQGNYVYRASSGLRSPLLRLFKRTLQGLSAPFELYF
jgi:hypothetical protein